MSSSDRSLLVRLSAQQNSSLILSASTTVTTASRRGIPYLVYAPPSCGMEQMVSAIDSGSHIPLASITI